MNELLYVVNLMWHDHTLSKWSLGFLNTKGEQSLALHVGIYYRLIVMFM